MAGDSAGGNLAAAICLMARDRHGPPVAAQVLLYPVIDPDLATESARRYGKGYVLTADAMGWYWGHYLGSDTPLGPEEHVFPLRAPTHRDLPRAVVVTAGTDPLRDEGEHYAATLRAAGVPTLLRRVPGVFHGFLTIPQLAVASSVMAILCADIAHLTSHQTQEVGQ